MPHQDQPHVQEGYPIFTSKNQGKNGSAEPREGVYVFVTKTSTKSKTKKKKRKKSRLEPFDVAVDFPVGDLGTVEVPFFAFFP